ncbi:hypothetical protein FQR65_LT07151 [Abscondita terminalis]|nr:hypothetical protein FQR65_LT07151 [Abscondita terminalis]
MDNSKYPGESLVDIGIKDSQSHQTDRRDLLINIILIGTIFVAASSSGMAIGYSAVLLPQLKLNSSEIPVDDNMGSWIASIITGSMPVGSVISGVVVDRIGRILTFKIQCLVVCIGCVTVAFSQTYEVMLVGRFISGVASGIGVVAGQVYFTEVCRPNIRGIISAGPFISYSGGILVVYALGAVLSWRIVAGVSAVPAVIAFIIFFVLPDSHIWLVKKNRIEEATKALIWFRGNKVDEAHEELKGVIARIKSQKVEEKFDYKYFFKPHVLKPFFIAITINFLQTLSGVYIVVFYATDIIAGIGIEDLAIDDMLVAVITALVRMLFTIVFCFLIVYISRRNFAVVSGLSTAMFTFILGTCLHYKITSYVIPVCLIIYVAATVGLLLLPGIMIGELFPIKARGVAGGLSHTLYSISIFVVAKAYPFLKKNLTTSGLFWLFGTSSLLLSALVYLLMPETKNKTLIEIEDYFMEKKLIWIGRKSKSAKRENKDECDKLNIQSVE